MKRYIRKVLKKILTPKQRSMLRKMYRKPSAVCHNGTSRTDTQAYTDVCLKASSDKEFFKVFRRNPVYNQMLEHVSESQGREYLQVISGDSEVMGAIDKFKANDDYGGPMMYEYPGIGAISPNTLRYVKVLVDLKKHFQTLDNMNICEIGGGYGGQCRVINLYYRPATYQIVDLQSALALAQRYLANYTRHSALIYKKWNKLSKKDYDLVLSNYAFTELRRDVQDDYLDKVILSSKRGYITYNELTTKEFNSYKASELIEIIPGSKMLKEEPLTDPKNCIIVWGENA